MLPPLFLAIGLFTAMDLFNITPGFATIVVGQLLYVIPYVLVVVTARLIGFDLELEQVARDLGAGPLQALRRITFRIVAPAILGAAILAFAFSFDEVLITNFTAGEQATLPLYVFSKLRRTVDPTVNAVATVLIVIPWIALGVAWFIVRTRGFGENRSRSTLA
jgi:ABC-type spermidine/putrescine transport system permease subunit II